MTPEPPLIMQDTGAPTRASVIWLHGLGASGHDFEPLIPQLGLLEHGVRFVLPHAPDQPVTINNGMLMPAWYDIRLPRIDSAVDEPGIRRAVAYVNELVAAEQAVGVPSSRIVLAGFSQGGAVALHAGLTYPGPLAGILALSTYLALPEQLAAERRADAEPAPVFLAHGTDDGIVPFALAEAAHRQLLEWGVAVRLHSYPMAHAICAEEVAAIRDWLAEILTPTATAY